MLDKLKYTLKHTLIYSLGNISTKAIGLVLLPLYTSYLTPEEYGIFAILEITSQVLVTILGFRLSTALLRFSTSEKQESKKKSIAFISLIATTISVLMLNLALHPFANDFSFLFFEHGRFSEYFTLLFFWASFEIFNRVFLDFLRIKDQSIFYLITIVLKVLTILLFNIYFIVSLNYGVKGIILGQLIGSGLVFVIISPKMLAQINYKFDWGIFKEMFSYGFPLIFSGLSTLLLSMGDRYLLKYFLTYSEVGVYSLGYKIASVINIFLIQSFQLGFLPIAFKMYDQPNAKRYFTKVLTYYSFILVFVSLAFSLFSKELVLLLSQNESYNIAYTLVPIIVLAFIFKGILYVFSIGLHYVRKTGYNASVFAFALVFNVLLNVLLIPIWGYYGAAFTAVLSNLLMAILFYYFSQKYYHVNYEISKIIVLMITGFFLFGLTVFISGFLPFILTIIFKFIVILSFPLLLYLIRFYDEVELETIKKIYNKWKRPETWKALFKRK